MTTTMMMMNRIRYISSVTSLRRRLVAATRTSSSSLSSSPGSRWNPTSTTLSSYSSWNPLLPQGNEGRSFSTKTNTTTLIYDDYLQSQIQQGKLQADVRQTKAAQKLQRLQNALMGYSNQELHELYEQYCQEQQKEEAKRQEEEAAAAVKRQAEEELANDNSKTTTTTTTTASPPLYNDANLRQSAGTPMKLGVYDPSIGIPASVAPKIKQNGVQAHQNQHKPFLPPKHIRVPRGLYIYGSVGTGKSMLMDAFYNVLDDSMTKKSRYHFHAFLAMVHDRIYQLKQQDLKTKGRDFHVDVTSTNNPIHRVAVQISKEISVLCLDEFQVTDIADAMILSQLFTVLFRMGTVVVATSNRQPTALYEGGLNREYFLPFLDVLQRHCIVHEMKSNIDYRILSTMTTTKTDGNDDDTTTKQTNNTMSKHMFFPIPNNDSIPKTKERVTTIVNQLRQNNNNHDDKRVVPVVEPIQLNTAYGRVFTVRDGVMGGVARFTFDELCDASLAASDYRAIAQNFNIIVLEEIPIMRLNLEEHNKARRFITLIDELYEAKVALMCTTISNEKDGKIVKKPSDLFVDDTMASGNDNNEGDDVALGIDEAITCGTSVGALASVRELSFAFQRAASRITEMTSPSWWQQRSLENENEENNDSLLFAQLSNENDDTNSLDFKRPYY